MATVATPAASPVQRPHPGRDHAPVHLAPGECRFCELPSGQGVELTLDGPTTCYYGPGLFYRSSPHVEILFWQSPHPVPPRPGLQRWIRRGLRWLCGGGDVLVHLLRSHGNWHDKPEVATLRVGATRRVQRISLQPGQQLWFLHKSFVCSSAEVEIRASHCGTRRAAVARALYVLEAKLAPRSASGTLFLAGYSGVECVTLQPGEGIRINQGHVIGVGGELDYICEPVTTAHISERGFLQQFKAHRLKRKRRHAAAQQRPIGSRLRELGRYMRSLYRSVMTAEGLYVYSVRNNSGAPAQIYLQVDCPFVPDSPGLLGLLLRYIAYVTKLAKLPGMIGVR